MQENQRQEAARLRERKFVEIDKSELGFKAAHRELI
jgi:hypothetical protein